MAKRTTQQNLETALSAGNPPLAASALNEQRRNASRTADAERSKPRHEVTIEKDVFVTMRDGTHIALDIYHPAEEGTYPPSTRSLRT